MTSSQAPCPLCSSDRIKRSHSRNIGEKLLKTFGIHAYRCINCGWRGFRIGSEYKQKNKARYSLLQIILIIFVTVLALIVIFYYLTREESQETMSYRNTKIIEGLVMHKYSQTEIFAGYI